MRLCGFAALRWQTVSTPPRRLRRNNLRLRAAFIANGTARIAKGGCAATNHGATFGPTCCSASARRSWTAAAAFLIANSAACNPSSAAASRFNNWAIRRVRDNTMRHRPEQQRAVGRIALNGAPHTTQARLVAESAVGLLGRTMPPGRGLAPGESEGSAVTDVCAAETGFMSVNTHGRRRNSKQRGPLGQARLAQGVMLIQLDAGSTVAICRRGACGA